MRKKISIIISAIITAALLAGCAGGNVSGPVNAGHSNNSNQESGSNASGNDTEETGADQSGSDNTDDAAIGSDNTSGTDTASGTDTGSDAVTTSEDDNSPWKTESAKKTVKLYEDFLSGKAKVYSNDVYDYKDGEQTLEELINGHSLCLVSNGMPDVIQDCYYSYIDCGNDGEPELGLKLVYSRNYSIGDSSTYYLVIRPIMGRLTLITSQVAYNRVFAEMNKYGFFSIGGSGGYSSSFDNRYFVSSDGEYLKLYDCQTIFGLSEPQISPDILPDSLSQIAAPDGIALGDDYYCQAYTFDDLDIYAYQDNYDQYYEDLAKSRYYTFYTGTDKSTMPDDDYVQKCKDAGLIILTESEMLSLLDERCALFGVSDEIKNGGEPEWTAFDFEDKVSKEAQAKLILDNSNMWLIPENDVEAGNEVHYAVADLNRNGRFELIRSERITNSVNENFCRNRFYEIGADYDELIKLDYEPSYYWDDSPNGELGGWEHDLLTASENYITCYWNSFSYDEGLTYQDTYTYIIPTLEIPADDNYLRENKMTLIFDGDTSIPNGYTLGMKFSDKNGKNVSYMDDGGLDCTQEMYETGIEAALYEPERGYSKDLVYIYYVDMVSDYDTDFQSLIASADSYWHYTEIPAWDSEY